MCTTVGLHFSNNLIGPEREGSGERGPGPEPSEQPKRVGCLKTIIPFNGPEVGEEKEKEEKNHGRGLSHLYNYYFCGLAGREKGRGKGRSVIDSFFFHVRRIGTEKIPAMKLARRGKRRRTGFFSSFLSVPHAPGKEKRKKKGAARSPYRASSFRTTAHRLLLHWIGKKGKRGKKGREENGAE